MSTPLAPGPRRLGASVWRVALALLPLGGGLAVAPAMLPTASDLSDPRTLALRILAGLLLSALSLTVLALLLRLADRRPLPAAGLTSPGTGWLKAVWGALLWTVPAAAMFGLLALLGTPMSVTAPTADLALTVLLLLLAVLVSEALPEEAVFRGYILHTLGRLIPGWWAIIVQALLFTVFAGLLRQSWDPLDLSLFLVMGLVLGWFRHVTGSVWMSIGFHCAFQTGSQLVLTHDAVTAGAGSGTVMLALGAVPFTVAVAVTAAFGVPSAGRAGRPAQQGQSPPAS